jgi:ketosteroid isomerase-like protein
MKTFLLSFFFAGVAACAADEATLRIELMRTDVEFSWMSLCSSRAEAFLHYMTADALLLNRGVRGREAARENFKSDPPGMRLSWGPTLVDVSVAGDLGYTVGIWHRSVPTDVGKVSEFSGMFCTVWRRQPDGTWKFICDGGEAMPDETIAVIESSLRQSAPAPPVKPPTTEPRLWRKELLEVDRGRSRSSNSGPWPEGLLAAAADDLMLFEPAAHSKTAAAKAFSSSPSHVRSEWEPWSAEIANSGDLAFTTGTWRLVSENSPEVVSARGVYLTLWKWQRDGSWKSVVQLAPEISAEAIAKLRPNAPE